uniref:GG10975 n=1 Tax=Drosophila erecta TaxID=7220 RepID=B3P2E6_DROER
MPGQRRRQRQRREQRRFCQYEGAVKTRDKQFRLLDREAIMRNNVNNRPSRPRDPVNHTQAAQSQRSAAAAAKATTTIVDFYALFQALFTLTHTPTPTQARGVQANKLASISGINYPLEVYENAIFQGAASCATSCAVPLSSSVSLTPTKCQRSADKADRHVKTPAKIRPTERAVEQQVFESRMTI